MHSTETKNQFLNLRAQGWSFDRIADQLHVSKPTLLDWNRKHHSKLETIKKNHQSFAQQSLRASHQRELQLLTMYYNALRRELTSRTLKAYSDDEIQALACDIEQQINRLSARNSAPDQLALSSASDVGKSNSVQPSPTKSNPIQPPLPLPVKER